MNLRGDGCFRGDKVFCGDTFLLGITGDDDDDAGLVGVVSPFEYQEE